MVPSISGCDIMHFMLWNGQYHMPKWCLLQDEKMVPVYKLLVFNNLRNVLIFRVFASEGESVRKYSLNFWGRTENSGGKVTRYWKSVSGPYRFHFSRKDNAVSGLKPLLLYSNLSAHNFYWPHAMLKKFLCDVFFVILRDSLFIRNDNMTVWNHYGKRKMKQWKKEQYL